MVQTLSPYRQHAGETSPNQFRRDFMFPRLTSILPLLATITLTTAGFPGTASGQPSRTLTGNTDKESSLAIIIRNGKDDLRSGAVVSVRIKYPDKSEDLAYNVNRGVGWSAWSTTDVRIPLSRPRTLQELRRARIIISHDGHGRNLGESYDNWDLQAIEVITMGCLIGPQIGFEQIQRLTGQNQRLLIPIQSNPAYTNRMVNTLMLQIETGADDGRADSWLHAEVRLRSGEVLRLNNLRPIEGLGYPANSFKRVRLPLSRSISMNEIESLTLVHNSASQTLTSYDNWDIQAAFVSAIEHCHTIASVGGAPWKHFDPSNQEAIINLR